MQHKCASNISLLGTTTLFGEGTQLATRGLAVCEDVEQLHGAEQADQRAAADDGEILNVVPLSSGVDHLPPELLHEVGLHLGEIGC